MHPGLPFSSPFSRHLLAVLRLLTPILVSQIGAVLFSDFLQYNPKDPKWLNRDRFVLSGGHGSMFLYSVSDDYLHITTLVPFFSPPSSLLADANGHATRPAREAGDTRGEISHVAGHSLPSAYLSLLPSASLTDVKGSHAITHCFDSPLGKGPSQSQGGEQAGRSAFASAIA